MDTRSWFLKIPEERKLGGTWKEQAVNLVWWWHQLRRKECLSCGRVCSRKNVGKPGHPFLQVLTGIISWFPQHPSPPTSPVCSAVLPPLACFVTGKTITVHLRQAKLYPDSLVVKRLWVVISLMVF